MLNKKCIDNRLSNRKKKWQKELFFEVWNNRIHNCVICWKYIPEPLSFVFAHIKSKWVYPELKFEPSNIALVCSLEHHMELDNRNSFKNVSNNPNQTISSCQE